MYCLNLFFFFFHVLYLTGSYQSDRKVFLTYGTSKREVVLGYTAVQKPQMIEEEKGARREI